jgi:hypothetical protein
MGTPTKESRPLTSRRTRAEMRVLRRNIPPLPRHFRKRIFAADRRLPHLRSALTNAALGLPLQDYLHTAMVFF